MKIIPTYVHGIIDYIYAAAFLALPNILGFVDLAPATTFSRIVGAVILFQALSTRYELGIFNFFSMKTHLMMDYGLGLLMIGSPWIFGFANAGTNVWLPFVVFGMLEEGATLMTQTEPRRRGSRVAHA